MNKGIDRKEIAVKIIKAAKKYKENLVGKTLLYVFGNKYIEVMFKSRDFKHLTGVDTNLSAYDFYKYSIKNKLQGSQIFFSERHPYNLAVRKINHLYNISDLVTGECFILSEISTKTESYKFGATDLNFSLCFDKDNNNTCFIVKSLRDEDCFLKSENIYVVTNIFIKNNDEKKYSKEIYCEKGYDKSDLSDNIKNLINRKVI